MIDNSKNIKYWEKRALLNLTESERIGTQTSNVLNRLYTQAYKDLEKELQSIYKNYSNETGLDVQRLKTLLTKKETDKTWKALEKQGLTKYIKKNYKARINIIEQKQAQIYAKIKLLHNQENQILKRGFRSVINHSYYKTCYDLQQGTGLNLAFSKLSFGEVNKIANYNWSGVRFSSRAFYNNGVLADEVVDIIGGALLSGQSFDKTGKQLRERFNVEGFKIDRLVRTESNYFHNQATATASEEMGFKKYRLSATLDDRTSHICQEVNGDVHLYSKKKVGENYPPFHPNCRTIAVPYINVDSIKTKEKVEQESFNEFKERNNI